MSELIIFPDVEGLVITHLKDALAGTPVSTKVPDTRPTRFIKVTVVGGNNARLTADSTMVTFQCWEADTVKASLLARTARAHIHAMEGTTVKGTWVYRVTDVGLPASNPDPVSNAPRYQFTVMIDVKGDVVND